MKVLEVGKPQMTRHHINPKIRKHLEDLGSQCHVVTNWEIVKLIMLHLYKSYLDKNYHFLL